MSFNLSNFISSLKSPSNTDGENQLVKNLGDIDRYFHDEKDKAFLIGRLLASYKETSSFYSMDLKPVIDYYNKSHFKLYFHAKRTISMAKKPMYNWAIFIFAVLFIILGVIRMSGGLFEIGLGTKYNVPIVIEGGLPVIIGFMLLVIAVSRHRYAKRKSQILNEFRTNFSTLNSA